ncbi:MAG: hypothetical protein CNE97_01155 [alpha proteobacterium MED-G10]|nr:MAG: hypothetical protein CNE97_01155 [alpha proteobacterium MED-G10]|tara:strand:- start:8405 stop:9526 length:1122 start_codon:yes stop_codon:yes gene_type:complete
MIKKFSPSTLLILFALSFPVLAQDSEEDVTDFGSPNQTPQTFDDSRECALSEDSELINLLNFKLKKFNPTSKEFESGPPLTEEEIKHKSIRFYSLQLKDEKVVKIDIDKFASLGGATLASLLNRSSKIFLRHPEKCEFFSLFGDSIIGHYEISFERILRLYATAVNKNNNIAQEFIRTQIIPSPMSLDSAIKSLYDDYGYQQNIIESLLPQEVRTLFFGENSMVSVADVAESKLLAFSLLGGRIVDQGEKEIFIFVPDSKKGLLGSNETIVISSSSKIYEVPLLNIPLALNVMRSLGFNAKIIILKHVFIDNESSCVVGEGGLWYHFKGNDKRVGCDFLSNTIRSIKSNTLVKSNDYPIFKESIDRVNEIINN